MKKVLLLLFIVSALKPMAQNVGIGVADPKNKLHMSGSLVVSTPSIGTSAAPTPSQTRTMINGTNILVITDSITRIYDPGGVAGNYLANMQATMTLDDPYLAVGYEVTLEDVDLGSGDSLIIRENSSSEAAVLLSIGNNYTTTGKWTFNSSTLYVIFKSNADADNGAGFSILARRLFDIGASIPAVSGFTKRGLFYDARSWALRSGSINPSPMGIYSFAVGNNVEASGSYSTAIGLNSEATGERAVAIGTQAEASGDNSVAIGSYVSTNGWEGSFSFGDRSTLTVMNTPAANNFRARFANGYRFYTSADYSTSCSLGAGDNAWTTTSDIRLKENFAPVDGEDILRKIAAMPLVTWNYKKQDPARFRHYGPMAQDFHAAFGKDIYGTIGSDTTINQADFAGVSFIAIQALEKRTVQQHAQIESLLKEIEALKAERPGKKEKVNRRKKISTR